MVRDEDRYAQYLLGLTLSAIWYGEHLGEECRFTNFYFVAKYHQAIEYIYEDPEQYETNGDIVMNICSSLHGARIFPWRFLSLPYNSPSMRGFDRDQKLIANPFGFDPYHLTKYFIQCAENMEEDDLLTEKEWMKEINFFFEPVIKEFEQEYSDYVANYGFTDLEAANLSEYMRAHTSEAEIPENLRKAINDNTF